MKKEIYLETFSGHRLRYAFQYNGAERYMLPYIERTEEEDYDILAPLEYIEMHRPYYKESTDDRYIEYKSLIGLTSLALLPYKCCIIHAVALLFEEYCWLITAPSGTGKSTQYFNFKSLYGKEVEMICGDMPVLEFVEDGRIMVHPSPWNGKERIQGQKCTALGGILYLRQGAENLIRRLGPEESVLPVMTQLAVLPDTEEQVLQMTSLADTILKNYPVWEMVNRGDLSSSRLAASTFLAYIKDKEHDI